MSTSPKPLKKHDPEVQTPKKPIIDPTLALMAGILALGLFIRLLPMLYSIVGGRVILMDPDSYYHMRRIMFTISNYPFPNFFDSYVNYPHGYYIGWPPLYDLICATASLLVGLGHPGALLTQVTSSMVSVLMGLGAIVLTFYIVRDIMNEKAALIAALILAIMPGGVFRSMFGVVGHHELEVLGSLVIFLLFMRALSSAKKSGMNLTSLKHPRPAIYAALAGLAIAAMIYSWDGSPIFIGIIVAYALVQYAYDAFNRDSSDYLTITGTITSLMALAAVIPFVILSGLGQKYGFNPFIISWFQVLYLLAFTAVFIMTGLISIALKKRESPWYSMPALIAILAAVTALAVRLVLPRFFTSIENGVLYLMGIGNALNTISEVQPLFSLGGQFSFTMPWDYFSFAGIIAILGLIVYIFIIKEKKVSSSDVFLLVWTAIVIVLCLLQTRFINLLSVNIAIFGGYVLCQALELAGLEEYLHPSEKKKSSSSRASASKSGSMSPALVGVAAVGVIILVPVFLNSIALAFSPDPTLPDWNNACLWLNANTPPTSYNYSEAVGVHPQYGVMSWWDYGDYILYVGDRPAIANNFQTGINDSADFFTTSNESQANAIMDKDNARYVMVDLRMGSVYAGVPDGIFEDIASLAGQNPNTYHDNTIANGTYQMTPEYYDSMFGRLFYGNGCGTNNTGTVIDGLDNYRLIYMTSGPDPVKIFEYVKGADITGKADPGATVDLSLPTSTPSGEENYSLTETAGQDGSYSFIVPYSTSNSTFVTTGPQYTITWGSSTAYAVVPESAVDDGSTVVAT
jgi:dolichyl-diphosphooligosaccharide--protein glycosyltransferase